jgi:hypothetical protein
MSQIDLELARMVERLQVAYMAMATNDDGDVEGLEELRREPLDISAWRQEIISPELAASGLWDRAANGRQGK